MRNECADDNEHVVASETYVQDISSVDGVNEACRRLNSCLNEMRKRGHGKIRVAVVEVQD